MPKRGESSSEKKEKEGEGLFICGGIRRGRHSRKKEKRGEREMIRLTYFV